MGVRSYDPKQSSIIVSGNIIEGYADGTFINVERNEDAFSLVIGSDGSGTRTKSNNRSGRMTITLNQSSPSNDILQGLVTADELSGGGIFSALHKDGSGNTINAAETAWIVKSPSQEFSNESSNREWIIETDNLEAFVGGNPA